MSQQRISVPNNQIAWWKLLMENLGSRSCVHSVLFKHCLPRCVHRWCVAEYPVEKVFKCHFLVVKLWWDILSLCLGMQSVKDAYSSHFSLLSYTIYLNIIVININPTLDEPKVMSIYIAWWCNIHLLIGTNHYDREGKFYTAYGHRVIVHWYREINLERTIQTLKGALRMTFQRA